MPKTLLIDRRFGPLFWSQFLGAFNDNVFRSALVILITYRSYSLFGVGPAQMVALCGGVFILPFFLFSATAGQVADRYSMTRVAVGTKVWEIGVAAWAATGFVLENVPMLVVWEKGEFGSLFRRSSARAATA